MLYRKGIIFSNLQIEWRKILAEDADGWIKEIDDRKPVL